MANVTTSGKASHKGGNHSDFEPDNRATRRKHMARAPKASIKGLPLKRFNGMHATRLYRI